MQETFSWEIELRWAPTHPVGYFHCQQKEGKDAEAVFTVLDGPWAGALRAPTCRLNMGSLVHFDLWFFSVLVHAHQSYIC